jgi:hypothetical protein
MLETSLDSAAHVVQLALTPIFLLTGLGSLLNVFSTRLGRVADRVDKLTADAEKHPRQLRILRLRSRILDAAVILVASAGALTCGAALTLFFGELRNANHGRLLFALFGVALLLSVMALAAFALETLLSGHAIREEADGKGDSAGKK